MWRRSEVLRAPRARTPRSVSRAAFGKFRKLRENLGGASLGGWAFSHKLGGEPTRHSRLPISSKLYHDSPFSRSGTGSESRYYRNAKKVHARRSVGPSESVANRGTAGRDIQRDLWRRRREATAVVSRGRRVGRTINARDAPNAERTYALGSMLGARASLRIFRRKTRVTVSIRS